MKTKKHFIVMWGNYGCLPDGCHVADTKSAALKIAAHEFGLSLGYLSSRAMRYGGVIALNKTKHYVDYIEVKACNCETPAIHEDG